MRRPRRRHMLIAATFLLVACSGSVDGQPGAVTADEARQLNEAAEMLDANSVDVNAAANDQEPS